jgi:hypothetical protein
MTEFGISFGYTPVMRLTRVTRVYNRTTIEIVLKVLVRVVELPREVIPIASSEHVELKYRDYMTRRFNPEMVPAIWVYDRSGQGRPLIDDPITPEQLRDNEDIVIMSDGECFQIQYFKRSLKNQLRYISFSFAS